MKPPLELPLPACALRERYELLAPLAQGGAARVYRARQRALGREVAVKVVPCRPEWSADAREAIVQRFRREVDACARLAHPGIVPLLDAGETDEALFAVFELEPGPTLRTLLEAEGALAVGEAVHLAGQVLDALGCVHAHGLVHRDVKPENVVVATGGLRRNARLLDFGLAACTTAAPGARGDAVVLGAPEVEGGAMCGTPWYAAPEQLRGELPSPRADLYSWGLLLFECLTGAPAVVAGSPGEAVMRQLAPDALAMPRWLAEHPLAAVLRHVTATAPERRPDGAATVLEALMAAAPAAAAAGRPADRAAPPPCERRQLTLVSCRLAAAAEGAQQGDPDAIDLLWHEQHDAIAALAARHGGRCAGTLGDRTLLAFGWPQARENDARFAARAALDAVEAVRAASRRTARERGLGFDVHVGIHSGMVLVREAQSLADVPRRLLGTTPRIAARLDAMAAPGEVLVSDDTRRLLRGAVACEPVEPCPGREQTAPVALHRLAPADGGGDPARGPHDTPLVARATELERLLAPWSAVQGGAPASALLTGEAGIGKSRLVRELRHRVGDATWLEARCVPESRDSPLRPLADVLTSHVGVPVDAALRRLGVEDAEHRSVLAELLDRRGGEPAQDASPQRRRELTLRALVALLARVATDRPAVLVIEDLHWADPTTLELVGRLLDTLAAGASGARLYCVCTARATFVPPWPPTLTTVIPLMRLSEGDVAAMVRGGVGGPGTIAPALLAEVVARADGIPLFVEEMTRVLLERDAGADGMGDGSEVVVPATLRDLLTARLDAVSRGARDTVQLAAALGREFSYDLLRAVAPTPEAVLRRDLRELEHAGLIHLQARARPHRWVFKHALLRDVAYEGMPRAAQREAHACVASTLERCFPEVGRDRPETLAQHLERAGRLPDAATWWKRSGDRTMARGAYVESIRHFTRGLRLLERSSARDALAPLELGLIESLGTAQLSTEGYASAAVEATFARAQTLCDRLGEEVPLRALHGLWGVQVSRGDRAAAAAILPRFHAVAARSSDPVAQLTAHAHTGLFAFLGGEFARARDALEASLPWYHTDAYHAFVEEYGYDGGLYAFAYLMWTLAILGEHDRALAVREQMLALAGRNRNPYGLAIAFGFAANLAHDLDDVAGVHDFAGRAIAHATEQHLYLWLGPATCMHGWALARAGDVDGGLAGLQHGLALFQMVGLRTTYPYHLALQAEVHLLREAPGDGLAAVDEALALTATHLDRFYEAELHRLRGELLAADGRSDEARGELERAHVLAERQGARTFAARAARALARLRAGSGSRAAVGGGRGVVALAPRAMGMGET